MRVLLVYVGESVAMTIDEDVLLEGEDSLAEAGGWRWCTYRFAAGATACCLFGSYGRVGSSGWKEDGD